MALQTDLSAKLDTGGLIAGLAGKITSFTGNLNGIAPPTVDQQAFSGAAGETGTPAAGLSGSVSSIATQLPEIVGHLPLPTDILGPIQAVLELVESFVTADIETQFRDLGASLLQGFSGTSDEGFLGVLLQAADLFGNSPQTRAWKDLLKKLTDLAGVQIPDDALGAPNLAPGVAALLRLLGGLMAEFTIVSEVERLSAAAAAQVDADRIERSTHAVTSFFRAGGPSLEGLVAATDPADSAQVDVAVTAVRQLRLQLEHWADDLTHSLAFGEATLVFMDIPSVQTDLAYAAQVLRQADGAALERLFTSIAGATGNLIPRDLLSGPQFALDQFFDQIEGRMQQVADKISAFDASAVTEPLIKALDVALDIPNRLGQAIDQVKTTISAVLEQVRSAVAALPLDVIRNALKAVLDVVTKALKVIGDLVTALKNLLTTAVGVFQTVLDNTDQALTEFRDAVKALFHTAVEFVNGLHLDQVVGQIADAAKELAGAIEKASMKPYFDTAADAIGTAADVVGKVPFSMLPDSMEQEVVDVLKPVKSADVGAFQGEIEGLLQIGPDGKFALRPDIENAVATIQKKFDDLLAEIKKRDPRAALAQVDAQLSAFGDKVRELSLQVDLSPVRAAIQQVRSAVQAVDPDVILKPLREGFDLVLAKLNEFSPDKLIAPVETRWNAARQKVLDMSHLAQWVQVLDDLKAKATQGLGYLDPAKFGPSLDAALNDALSVLDRLPQLHAGSAFGSAVAALYQGSRLRVLPIAFEPVLDWMGGVSGSADLRARAGKAAETLRSISTALTALDLPSTMTSLSQSLQSLRSAVGRLAPGPGRDKISAELDAIDLPRIIAPFQANHTRFFATLERTTNEISQLAAEGFSEVDDGVRRLREAWAPMVPVTSGFTGIFAKLGITGFDVGLGEVVKRIVAVASPSRIIAVLQPLCDAVHSRLQSLVNSVLDPLRSASQRLIDIFNSLSLTPLKDGLMSIHGAIVGQIAQFHPDQLLKDSLTAFNQLRTQVMQFDPVADIQSILDNLAKSVDKVLKNLNVEELLAEPLKIYDQILALLSGLKPGDLLQPVLDQLDRIASEVDEGLTETVTAFRALQDAIPDHVGSISLSASASVG